MLVLTISACGNSGSGPSATTAANTDPPEVQLGERLFLETRFAEFFFANSKWRCKRAPAKWRSVDEYHANYRRAFKWTIQRSKHELSRLSSGG